MDHVVKLTEKQKELIERLGVFNEENGYPPAISRILSLLLVSPETALSFDQIRETLNLSKSACSNALNLLLTLGKIEYITKPGDRKRYFRNKITSWQKDIKEGYKKINSASDILEEVLENRPGSTTEFNQSLKDLISFMKFLKNQLPTLYEKWEKERN